MALELLHHDDAVFAPPAGGRLSQALRRIGVPDWQPPGLLVITAIAGFVWFVLGVGNRFTRGPLFIYIPDVALMPPLNKAAWEQAFFVHQQSPLWALCGGYQVGGMESLTVYQFLYMWEWLRAGSVYVVAACAIVLGLTYVRRLVATPDRSEVMAALAVAAFGALYLVLRTFADHAGWFATINIGQHRHALDVSFASLALAALVAAAASPRGAGWPRPLALVFAFFVVLDIAFGALFEATDAAVVWDTFPGYGQEAMPGPDRLFAFSPVWRNLTENAYLIQACHRLLSFALWLAALAALTVAVLHRRRLVQSALLFTLLTLDGVLGIATLLTGEPSALSVAHQVGAVLVLAVALAPARVRVAVPQTTATNLVAAPGSAGA
jgi:cytochrome c oxidase assembly protein subunit 15